MSAELQLVLTFAFLSIINVIFSTIKSLVTIKGNKYTASIINALYYSYYNIVIIYTVAEFDLLTKCLITFLANILGVFIVKLIEERSQKDKRWVFVVTVEENISSVHKIHSMLKEAGIKSFYDEIVTDSLYSMQIFSNTKKESKMITSILENYNMAYHVLEDICKKPKNANK